jgi:hypothetical protein
VTESPDRSSESADADPSEAARNGTSEMSPQTSSQFTSLIELTLIDQIVFGLLMFLAMVSLVVGAIMVVESNGKFPYVLIGGAVLAAAALAYLRYRDRHAKIIDPPRE